jgi:hypothetical protein
VLEALTAPQTTPRPANASFPYGDISALAGVYDNEGYGKVEWCYASSNSTNASDSCKALVADPSVKSIVGTEVPTLLAKWGNQFISHVALSHFDGAVFNVSGSSIIVSFFSLLRSEQETDEYSQSLLETRPAHGLPLVDSPVLEPPSLTKI